MAGRSVFHGKIARRRMRMTRDISVTLADHHKKQKLVCGREDIQVHVGKQRSGREKPRKSIADCVEVRKSSKVKRSHRVLRQLFLEDLKVIPYDFTRY